MSGLAHTVMEGDATRRSVASFASEKAVGLGDGSSARAGFGARDAAVEEAAEGEPAESEASEGEVAKGARAMQPVSMNTVATNRAGTRERMERPTITTRVVRRRGHQPGRQAPGQ